MREIIQLWEHWGPWPNPRGATRLATPPAFHGSYTVAHSLGSQHEVRIPGSYIPAIGKH